MSTEYPRHALERALAGDEWEEPEEENFTRISLADIAEAGITEPKLTCDGRLYLGSVHSLAGPPDSGKTSLGYWWALDTIRHGRPAVIFDQECGPDLAAERLLDLGATHDELARLHYYPYPGRTWGPSNLASLARLLAGIQPALMLWDSCAEFMATGGYDEDRAADVTSFYSRVLGPCARDTGAAVVVLDHDAKRAAGSRYARGSGAKLAGVDVAYKVEVARPFSRTQDGALRLTVPKDRRGWLRRFWDVHVTRDPLAFTMTEGADATPGLSPAQVKLAGVLADEPLTAATLVDRVVAAHGHGLKRETASRALSGLLEAGYADRLDQGSGRPALWMRKRRSDA